MDDKKDDTFSAGAQMFLLGNADTKITEPQSLFCMEESKEESAPKSISSVRNDIVSKIFLRMIRRFYYRLFKQENPKIWTRRLKQVRFLTQLRAAKKFVKKYFNEDSETLAHYFLRILDLNGVSKRVPKFQSERSGMDFLLTTKLFAKARYRTIHQSPEFQKIFNYLYTGTLPDSERKCMDALLETEAKNFEKYPGKFQEEFDHMQMKFRGIED